MDALSNPYTPGAGTRPPALTGRDEQLGHFEPLSTDCVTGVYRTVGTGSAIEDSKFTKKSTTKEVQITC